MTSAVQAILGGGNFMALEPGVYEATFHVDLPAGICPSYQGRYATNVHRLLAYVDLPARPDLEGHVDLRVRTPDALCRFPALEVGSSEMRNWGRNPPLRLGVDAGSLRRGVPVNGRVWMLNPMCLDVRSLTVVLARREAAWAQHESVCHEDRLGVVEIPRAELRFGEEQRFAIPYPTDPLVYQGRCSTVSVIVQAIAVVSKQDHAVLTLTIAPPSLTAQSIV